MAKAFLGQRSRRFGYDGWALRIREAKKPMDWTTCTTRREARELRKERNDLFDRRAEIVKVRITVEVAE